MFRLKEREIDNPRGAKHSETVNSRARVRERERDREKTYSDFRTSTQHFLASDFLVSPFLNFRNDKSYPQQAKCSHSKRIYISAQPQIHSPCLSPPWGFYI